MMKKGWMMLSTALLAGSLLGGCAEKEMLGLSGDEMIEKVVAAETKPASYYAEGEMKIWSDDKLNHTMHIKEWVDGETGRKRTETEENGHVSYAVNNGTEITIYEKETGTAYSMDVSAMGQQPEQTQKQMLVDQLERLRDSHDVDMMGQEKLQGQDVIHIKLTPKEEGTLSISSEYWVDPKTWMIVKVISTYGDEKSEMVYDPIQYDPEFSEDTFVIDIPKEVDVKDLNDLTQNSEVSLEEAEQALGQPFLQDMNGELELSRIEMTSLGGELSRDEVTLYYVNNDKVEVSMTVFKAPDEDGDDTLLPDESEVEVRDTEGSYMKSIRNISWTENGLRYSIMGENEEWTKEKLQAWAKDLKLPNQP
ncbi:LolA family protein [Paenibacillus hubeiensis]|uniref:LolA family protein n=1 Tax=Paenibacillus hubeiensis TaxID=3077330 RepID=UPI0031BA6A62